MDMFYVHDDIVITSAKEDMFSSLFVCLLAKKCERICMKFSGKVANGPLKKMIKFRWRSGSPSRYRIRFPDSSLLGDTKVFTKVLVILIRQMVAVVRRFLTEVGLYTVPALNSSSSSRYHRL